MTNYSSREDFKNQRDLERSKKIGRIIKDLKQEVSERADEITKKLLALLVIPTEGESATILDYICEEYVQLEIKKEVNAPHTFPLHKLAFDSNILPETLSEFKGKRFPVLSCHVTLTIEEVHGVFMIVFNKCRVQELSPDEKGSVKMIGGLLKKLNNNISPDEVL